MGTLAGDVVDRRTHLLVSHRLEAGGQSNGQP